MTKSLYSAALIAFIVFFVVTQPQHAANIVHGGWRTLVNVAHGVGDFLGKLA